MKRPLDEKEVKLSEKGLKMNEETLKLNEEALAMSLKHKEFLKIKREYEDLMRPFNRKNEDTELNNTIKGYESEIRLKKEIIAELQKQLNEGVEIKDKTQTYTG